MAQAHGEAILQPTAPHLQSSCLLLHVGARTCPAAASSSAGLGETKGCEGASPSEWRTIPSARELFKEMVPVRPMPQSLPVCVPLKFSSISEYTVECNQLREG